MSRRAWSVVIALGAAVLAVNVVLEVLDRLVSNPSGPASSSYATAPDGLAAYADLLRRSGHPVARVREAPADAELPAAATVVVLDAQELEPEDVAALRRFVERGGRLVAGGVGSGDWLAGVLDDPPAWTPDTVGSSGQLAPVPEVAGVSEARAAGPGAWSDTGQALPALGDDERTLVAVAGLGRGRAVLLADASPLQNRRLDEADNAALGLALAGPRGRPARFLESVHGYGLATGLGAIPTSWVLALGGLVLAALVFMVARGRRLGPPEPEGRELPPPRREYVDAVAATLARTGRPAEAAEGVRSEARARIARAAGLGPEPDGAELREAGRRLGLDGDELDAVLLPPRRDADVLAAGRALAHLAGGPR